MKKEFTEEIKQKVFGLIEWLPEDYNYNLTINIDDDEEDARIALVVSDGTQVWVIKQEKDNYQSLATFLMEGQMLTATFPSEIMEVANDIRNLNAEGKLDFAWDYIEE